MEITINSYIAEWEQNPIIPVKKLCSNISEKLGISETTISRMIAQYRKNKSLTSSEKAKMLKNVVSKTDDSDKRAIRRKVHQFWFNRKLPTLDKILTVVNEDESLPQFTHSSLYRLLKSMKFENVNRGHDTALCERDDIILERRKYLTAIKKYRGEGRPIYYLKIMWLNAEDVSDQEWTDKPVKNKEKQIVVVHIGSEDGFVPDGLLCYEFKNGRDYQDEINGDFFREWLESVLPRLKDNAVIVMDNSHLIKKCSTNYRTKAELIQWLESKGEVIDRSMHICELLEIVKRLKPISSKRHVINEMVLQHNKLVLWLPPYHCEFNLTELALSVVKNHLKFINKKVVGTEKVDAVMWKNFVSHIISEEDKFWELDYIVDDLL